MESQSSSNYPVPSRKRTGRSSLLRQVTLTDGQLAWPVAQAAGLSEVTFRSRLKAGLSPDEAVSRPVAKRGPSRTAERAQWHAQRDADLAAERAALRAVSTRSWSEEHMSASGDYSGVIWADADWRLIVSPRGATYALQVLGSDGLWEVDRDFPSASLLCPWLMCAAIDPPPALLQAAAGLPDDPGSSGFSPYRRSPS